MAEQRPPQKKAKSAPNLILKSGINFVNKKYSQDNTDIVFKNRETGQEEAAHKTVLSQISPFFSTWFKEEWTQDKDRTEYPVPGDIEWEIFSNVISFLYGHQVEFEEDTLPDLFKAADYLQLDSLKVAIIERIPDQWELKDPSIAGAMCTAVASQTDPRVISGWLYTVSVRYLIRNVQMIVNNVTIDLSPLPYDVMMEIAQSEEIRAPEVQLYHFLRMWAEKTEIKPSLEEVQSLFGHVRYATIPHQELEQIGKYPSNNNHKFWAAFNGSLQPVAKKTVAADMKQFTNRKCQEVQWLLNTSRQKKWTREIKEVSSPIYTVVSDKRKRAIVMTWSVETEEKEIFGYTDVYVAFVIHSLSTDRSIERFVSIVSQPKNTSPTSAITTTRHHQSFYDQLEPCRISAAGLTMRLTSTGIEVELFRSSTGTIEFAEPYPWLIEIRVNELEDVIVQTL